MNGTLISVSLSKTSAVVAATLASSSLGFSVGSTSYTRQFICQWENVPGVFSMIMFSAPKKNSTHAFAHAQSALNNGDGRS